MNKFVNMMRRLVSSKPDEQPIVEINDESLPKNEWLEKFRRIQNLHSIEKAVFNFVNDIIISEPHFDFSPYKITLQALPESTAFSQPYMDLSPAAQEYLDSLDILHSSNPQSALKLTSILVGYQRCSYYPQKLQQAFNQKQNDYLSSDKLPRKERIEWGLYCWKNWPQQDSSREVMVATLVQLFIQEANVDPEYILTQYDSITGRGSSNSYIFHMFEDAENFLKFARLVKEQRPVLLIDSLERCLCDARRGYGDYHPTEATIRAISKELFELSEDSRYSAIINQQIVCWNLIKYAYPDESWYAALFQKLWTLECAKPVIDAGSAMNYFFIALNAPCGHRLIPVVQEHFNAWAFNYQHLYGELPDALIARAKKLIDLVNGACNEKYAMTRNKSIPVPESCILVVDAMAAYWQMVEWLKGYNPKFCFYVLNAGFERDTFTVKQTECLGEQAHQQFVDMFEAFCKQHIEDSVELIAYMIDRSHFSTIDSHLCDILDIIYPIFCVIDESAASRALEIGSSIKRVHIEYWYPNKKRLR